MNMKRNFLVGLGAFLVAQTPAWSYTLSPCFRVLTYDKDTPAQKPVRQLGKLCEPILKSHEGLAVHEHMSAASIRKVSQTPFADTWQFRYMNDNQWPAYGGPARSYAIIFGTWWNDDPLMLTLGQGTNFSKGGIHSWRAIFQARDTYRGGRSECQVKADIHLARQSHLGKLQHLHFMRPLDTGNTSREQHIQTTVDNALTWMSFTYQVATGDLAPDASISPEMEQKLSLPSIAENFCVEPESVKVRTLFTPISNDKDIPLRDRRTPEIALGSMLHVLQDSFAPAHACRVSRAVGTAKQALLVDVDAYRVEDKARHSLRDGYPDWFIAHLKSGQHVYENDPVAVGAWLIAAVDAKRPWSEVEAHLRATIFASTNSENGEKCIDGTPIPGK